jgi:hypothetical protein
MADTRLKYVSQINLPKRSGTMEFGADMNVLNSEDVTRMSRILPLITSFQHLLSTRIPKGANGDLSLQVQHEVQ